MEKFKKLIAAIIMIATLGITATSAACTNNQTDGEQPTSTALEYGYHLSGGDGFERPSEYCAYKADTNTFDIDDVTLTFSFGTILPPSVAIQGLNIPEFDICFQKEGEEQKHLVRHVTENFSSEEFTITPVYDEEFYLRDLIFNHSESITIPSELFTEPHGTIWFMVVRSYVKSDWENKWENYITCANIYYDINGDKVVLSSKDNNGS